MSLTDQTRQGAVFDQLRRGILSGTLPANARLPPTRALAEELGVARQTVVLAYERLAAEGYVRARTGSGTFVTADLPDAAPAPKNLPPPGPARLSCRGAALAAIPATARPGGISAGLLAAGVPAPELFPAQAWARCSARTLATGLQDFARYPDPQGYAPLRAQIAAHLAATRGLLAEPEQIVVTAGTQQALAVAAELLLDPGDAAWVEDPGYIAGRGALRAAGAALVGVPSGAEGLDVAAGSALAPQARLALVAPSHATPLGGALPIGQRLALLDWAAREKAWVLEDDCDAEFRWEGRPLPPLATLDRGGRVIYCGTFSKTLAPALRLGFAVLPAPLVEPFVRLRTLADRGTGELGQAVLAEFMRQGLLGPHVRRMRTEYMRRRAALLGALDRFCPALMPLATPGGLHLVLRLPPELEETRVVRAAHARDLAVAPLGAYFLGRPRLAGLVVGFAATPAPRAAEAARGLAAALRAA
ncbi:MAG: PLP-dependent aminotransferase family protein [Acidisphaera sp.]|nr:PLP-dependent aminotransferase family protein [Acidisphaera sp.]